MSNPSESSNLTLSPLARYFCSSRIILSPDFANNLRPVPPLQNTPCLCAVWPNLYDSSLFIPLTTHGHALSCPLEHSTYSILLSRCLSSPSRFLSALQTFHFSFWSILKVSPCSTFLYYSLVYRLFTSIFVEDNIFQWIFSGILFFTMFSKQEKNYGTILAPLFMTLGSFLMLYRLLITTFATNVSYLICSAIVCLIKQQYYVIWNFDMSGFLPIVLALFVYDLRAYNSLYLSCFASDGPRGSLLSQDRLQVLIIFLSIFFLMSFSTISSVLVGAVCTPSSSFSTPSLFLSSAFEEE